MLDNTAVMREELEVELEGTVELERGGMDGVMLYRLAYSGHFAFFIFVLSVVDHGPP
jgi:hypothetical protein